MGVSCDGGAILLKSFPNEKFAKVLVKLPPSVVSSDYKPALPT